MLRVRSTPDGYANILISRPFDTADVKRTFEGRDVCVAARSASTIIKKNANIFVYAEPDNA
jgi:hypothetical protein